MDQLLLWLLVVGDTIFLCMFIGAVTWLEKWMWKNFLTYMTSAVCVISLGGLGMYGWFFGSMWTLEIYSEGSPLVVLSFMLPFLGAMTGAILFVRPRHTQQNG